MSEDDEFVELAFAAQGIREFYEGGVAPLPDGVVPLGECPGCGEPWPCGVVRDISKQWEEGPDGEP